MDFGDVGAGGTLRDWQAALARTKKEIKIALNLSALREIVCVRIGVFYGSRLAVGPTNSKALITRTADSRLKLTLWMCTPHLTVQSGRGTQVVRERSAK